MKPFLLATQNPGKVREFRELLSADLSHLLIDAPSSEKLDIVENGVSYRENAVIKAKAFLNRFQMPVLSDDSGLEIDALMGQPGLHSAVYGGESLSWEARWKLLHRQLAPFPSEQWTARFRCVLCFLDQTGGPRYFESTVEGKILVAPIGSKGFGYDPIFFCQELNKGFGEASSEEKNRVSHRAKAVRAFVEWYRQRKVS